MQLELPDGFPAPIPCIHGVKHFLQSTPLAPALKCPMPEVALGTVAEHTDPAAGDRQGGSTWEFSLHRLGIPGTGLAWLKHPGDLSMVLESSGVMGILHKDTFLCQNVVT